MIAEIIIIQKSGIQPTQVVSIALLSVICVYWVACWIALIVGKK